MRYRVLFYPMLNQTLAVTSMTYDDIDSERQYTHTYELKTKGNDTWALEDMLRELADEISANNTIG